MTQHKGQDVSETHVENSVSNKVSIVFFDLETIPDDSRIERFDLEALPVLGDATPDKDLPTAEEIGANTVPALKSLLVGKNPSPAWFAGARQAESAGKSRKGVMELFDDCESQIDKIRNAGEDRRKLLSCTPEYCRIAALGLANGSDEIKTRLINHEDQERAILGALWKKFETANVIVGYNILQFDLPVIMTRSILLGVPPTCKINLSPYNNTQVIDLYQRRFPKGSSGKQPGKMKDQARLLGIDVPAGEIDGSQVLELYLNDPEKLREYVASDVWILRELYSLLNGYWF